MTRLNQAWQVLPLVLLAGCSQCELYSGRYEREKAAADACIASEQCRLTKEDFRQLIWLENAAAESCPAKGKRGG